MKKLLLSVLILFCLCACGEPDISVSAEPETSPTATPFDFEVHQNPVKLAKDQQYRDGFSYSVYVDHITINGYTGAETDVVIPQEIDGIPVTVVTGQFVPSVKNVTLPEGLKHLSLNSFAFCTELNRLDLPASLESLSPAEPYAQSYVNLRLAEDNPYLTMEDGVLFDGAMETLIYFPRERSGSYTLPDTVQAIDTYAFCSCNVQEVVLPEGLLEIRPGAFYNCQQLEKLSLPKSLVTLDRESLLACEGLRSVEVPDENPNFVSVDGILYSKDMTELLVYPTRRENTEFSLPEGVQQGWQLIFMSKNLKTVHLPDSIRGPSSIFQHQLDIQVYFHGSAEEWMLLFQGMVDVAPAHIIAPENPPEEWAFEGDFAYTLENGKATLRAYLGSDYEIQIPDALGGCPVTEIGTDALAFFSRREVVENADGTAAGFTETCKVIVPEGVTSIGDRAFYSSCLFSLTLPSTLEHMGTQAMAFCEKLAEITVAEENPNFYAADGTLYTGDRTTLLHVSALVPNDGRESPLHPAGFSTDYMVRSDYTLPTSVSSVHSGAFLGCTWLETISVAAGNSAFAAEKGSLTTLDGQTLVAYPPGTEMGQIPDSVKKIGPWAFGGARSMPNRMGHLLRNITELSENAFAYSGFPSAVLPETVTRIPARAFFGSSITEAVIPAGVTAIGQDAFLHCDSLETVRYAGTAEDWAKIAIAPGNETLETAVIHFELTDQRN